MTLDFTRLGTNLLLKVPFLYSFFTNIAPFKKVTHFPNPCWSGTPKKGNDILNHIYCWAGYRKENDTSPWDVEDAPYAWTEQAHSFTWLYDTRLSTQENARKTIQQWIMQWLEKYNTLSQPAWRSDIVARRLTNLLVHFDHYFIHTDKKLHDALLSSITQHYKHLEFTEGKECDQEQCITALRGLIIGAISLEQTTHIKRHILHMCQLLDDTLDSDGFNVYKHLPTQISYLKNCILIRSALHNAQMDVPNILNKLIKKIIPSIRFFYQQDGDIAHMAGWAGESNETTQLIKRSNLKTSTPVILHHSQYYHIDAGRTSVLFDGASRTAPRTDNAGVLSFELSHEKQRIFVNCGLPQATDHNLYHYARGTPAYSCPAIQGYNATSLNSKKRTCQVKSSLTESQGWQLLQGSHNGYYNIFSGFNGIVHRDIALNPDGTEIRGQDYITEANKKITLESRFHLHPQIEAMCLPNNKEIILQYSKTGWCFRVSGATLSLKDSYYINENGKYRRSQQIVIHADSQKTNPSFKWTMKTLLNIND